MKRRFIVTTAITACLALCAAVWPQTEKVEKPPTPSETANVTTPRPTLPEPEELILPAITEKQESGMPEAESAPEVAAKELPIPAPEIEKQFEAEQKTAPPMQTEPAPVHPTQSESAPEPIANDNELADMVYVPGFGWIRSEGPNHVEYAEDMYENGNKIGRQKACLRQYRQGGGRTKRTAKRWRGYRTFQNGISVYGQKLSSYRAGAV